MNIFKVDFRFERLLKKRLEYYWEVLDCEPRQDMQNHYMHPHTHTHTHTHTQKRLTDPCTLAVCCSLRLSDRSTSPEVLLSLQPLNGRSLWFPLIKEGVKCEEIPWSEDTLRINLPPLDFIRIHSQGSWWKLKRCPRFKSKRVPSL